MPKIVADKSEWVKLGFELFAKHGISGVVVDNLAKILKCNRSSFYWHFNTKEVFIVEILKYWIAIDTTDIIALTEKATSAREKFKLLIEASFKSDPHIDFIFHLKRYAINRKDIQKIIDKIDAQRINFVISLLKEIGYSEGDAIAKGHLFYKYLIGYHEMNKYKTQADDYVENVYTDLRHFISI